MSNQYAAKLNEVLQGEKLIYDISVEATKFLEEKHNILISHPEAIATIALAFIQTAIKNTGDSIEFKRTKGKGEDVITAVRITEKMWQQIRSQELKAIEPIVFNLKTKVDMEEPEMNESNVREVEEPVNNLGAVGEITEAIAESKEQE